MKRFWTTAAVAALCAFAADAWAGPQTQYLELVAAKPLRGSQETAAARRHAHAKAAAAKSKKSAHARRGAKGKTAPAKGRRGRRHAEEEETAPVHGRHGRRRAVEETQAPERGRHGRRHESDIRNETSATVTVGRHDTLESISHRTGVTIPELARLNRLKRPYHVRLGARLKLPQRRYYVVKSGDTLYSLGRKFDVDEADLAAFNSIEPGRHIRIGQKLYLPGRAVEAALPEEEAPPERPTRRTEHRAPIFTEPFENSSAPAPQQPYAPLPSTSETPAQPTPAPATETPLETPAPRAAPYQAIPAPPATVGRPIIQSAPPPSAADVAAAGRGKFAWPVQGDVISGFGPKADGQRNDGVNISANEGDPVRAAADGEVVYAGDQVPSFGNLVLIKHPGGWVTAYAHMAHILVHNRDPVVQGQQIGVVGQTGSVDRPQVHFEIRYAPSPKDKAAPVDPALLLPQR